MILGYPVPDLPAVNSAVDVDSRLQSVFIPPVINCSWMPLVFEILDQLGSQVEYRAFNDGLAADVCS